LSSFALCVKLKLCVIEPEGSMPLIPNPTIEYGPEPPHSPPIRTTCHMTPYSIPHSIFFENIKVRKLFEELSYFRKTLIFKHMYMREFHIRYDTRIIFCIYND
jgi:hypothetical protein